MKSNTTILFVIFTYCFIKRNFYEMIILLKVLIDSEYTFVYITVCYSDTANLNSVFPLYAILMFRTVLWGIKRRTVQIISLSLEKDTVMSIVNVLTVR